MMKRNILLIPVLVTLLAGCGKMEMVNLSFDNGKDLNQEVSKGALGDFELLTPANNAIVNAEPTFSWTASEHAYTYTLEVCSSDTFDSTSTSVVYSKETNISSTSYKLTANLRLKNHDYFWRVTAVNEYNSKSVGKEKVSEVKKFRYNIESVGEIDIGVGEAEDWTLHKVGSEADIAIDHNDFFGTGNKDSLKITFEKEKTSQGPITSIGWLDVQKAVDKDFYGTDALYCDFYFMGHDSTILLRVIDQDGELWYKQVKFTQDARQIALLKFEDFILRNDSSVVVQNEEFNYEYIQAIEVCFEKTFGDGCCIVGGLKAVNYDAYKDLFIESIDFKSVAEDHWLDESYKFKRTISDDGSELKIEYSTVPTFNGNTKAINEVGYGFSKIKFDNKYFTDGNAIKVTLKYTGISSNGVNAVIRILESDTDRWYYEHPLKVLTADEFEEITIPYMAFQQSQISEGKRQFYSVSQLQFGVNTCYGAGTITFKDFKIVTVPGVSENKREVGNDGIIEDFDSYIYRGQAYKYWETSVDNKDEGIFLENTGKFPAVGNVFAGKFTYKSDMSMATYDIYTDVKVSGLNGIKFWLKDGTEPQKGYSAKDVCAQVTFQVYTSDNRAYRYTIEKAPKLWTEYELKFTDFKLHEGKEYDTSPPVTSELIINFAFGIQYFYMNGEKANPLYAQNNPVFIDSIMFTNCEASSDTKLEQELHPDTNGITLIDNFEYQNQQEIESHWYPLNNRDYELITLSNDVSCEGGSHSMQLDYKGANSPSYCIYPVIGEDVRCRAISLDIKGDNAVTIFVNLYVKSGSTTYQYRATITNPTNSWNRYVIGLDKTLFVPIGTPGPELTNDSLVNLSRFTFGAVNNNNNTRSSFFVDNIKFVNKTATYTTNTVTPIVEA